MKMSFITSRISPRDFSFGIMIFKLGLILYSLLIEMGTLKKFMSSLNSIAVQFFFKQKSVEFRKKIEITFFSQRQNLSKKYYQIISEDMKLILI